MNSGGPVAYLLGEWQVQGVIRAGSGFPYTLSGRTSASAVRSCLNA